MCDKLVLLCSVAFLCVVTPPEGFEWKDQMRPWIGGETHGTINTRRLQSFVSSL